MEENKNNLETTSEQTQTTQEVNTEPKVIEIQSRPSFFSYFLSAMVIFGVCFVCFLFVFQILLQQIGVHGYSMQPTINAQATGTKGDQNTDTVFYIGKNKYKYQDIVIINEGKTSSGNEKLIKRVIATPGQTITFKSLTTSLTSEKIPYEIYIDGKKLDEDYIKDQNVYFNRYSSLDIEYPFFKNLMTALKNEENAVHGIYNEFSYTLSSNEYFVMGDNRNNSIDSRYFGPVSKNEIAGKVVLHVENNDSLITSIFKNIFATRLISFTKNYKILP